MNKKLKLAIVGVGGTGSSRPGRLRLIGVQDEADLLAQVSGHPGAMLAEHCALWQASHGVPVSLPTMGRALQRLGLMLKKRTLIAPEQNAAARSAWRAVMATVDPARLIFLDEASTPTTLTPLRGRSPRGHHVVGRVPRGRWEAVTLVAMLTPTGFGPGLQVAGPLDRAAFDTFVTGALVPSLRPGAVVVLDNLSVHKSVVAQRAIEAVGARVMFLPAYSPDFNPIEQAFAKLKQGLRAAGARTTETVMTATREVYPRITAIEARAYYRHAGYSL